MDFTRDTIKIQVSFSIWNGKFSSEKGRDDVVKANNAKRDIVEVKVIAIPRKAQAKIFQVKQAMTDAWHEMTAPWEDGGWRLGLVTDYIALRTKLDELKRQYDDAVFETIDRNYEALKSEYLTNANTMAVYTQFPSKQVLLRRYGCRIAVDKIASSDDLRFSGLSEDEVERIVGEREQSLKDTIEASNEGLLKDVANQVKFLVDSLGNYEANFRGSEYTGFPIFKNVESMLDRCDRLNISKSASFAKRVDEVRKHIRSIDPTACQLDLEVRKKAVKTAKSVLEDLTESFA
jgi:hypothetical protein